MPRAADRVAYKLRFEGQDSAAGQYLWERGTCTKTPTKLWPTWYEIALDTEGGERIMVVITRDNYGTGAGGCWRFIDPPPLAPPAAAAADAATRTATRTANNAPNRNVTILGSDDQVAQNIATMSDRKLRGEKSSSYIGVSWGVTGHVPAWTARFAETDRATVHLGRYHDEAEAARAYDTEARRQQRGTRAPGAHNGRGYYRLNFPTAEEQAAWSRRDRVGAAIAAETETGQQRGVPSQENGHGHGHGRGEEDEVGTSTSTAPPVVAVRVGHSECQSSPPPPKQPPFIPKSKIPKKRHRVLQKGEPAVEVAVEVAAGAAPMPMMNDVPNHPRQVVKHRVPSSSLSSGGGGGGILDRATAQHASDASRKRKLLRSGAPRSASCLDPQKAPQDYQHELQQAPAADRCSEPANSAR